MIPNPQAPVVDGGGKITPVWFRWLSELRGSADASAPQSDVDAAIAAIATALGSPDGTVANIPPQSEANIRLLQGAGIAITGDAANGYAIAIRPLADTATGTFKLVDERDSFGRITGVADGTAADVPYVNTTSGLSAANVQAAIDELSAEKLDDAPSDGTTYGRKDGAWSAVTGGGGGGGTPDPTTTSYRLWEFHDGVVTSANTGTSFLQNGAAPVVYVAGSGAGASMSGTSGRPAQLTLTTGTSSTGYARMYFSAGPRYVPGGGTIRAGVNIIIPTLSTSGERFGVGVGFFDNIGGAISNRIDAVYEDDINGGLWRLRAWSGGVLTSVDTATVGPAAGVETLVELEINAAGTSVELFVDGVSQATVAISITAAMAFGLQNTKALGITARTVICNYAEFEQTFTTAR